MAGYLSQDGGEDAAVAAADVGQDSDAGEVVGVQHRRRFPTVDTNHRLIENLGLLWMILEEIEDRHPVELVEGDLAGLHAVEKLAEGVIVFLARP